MLRRLEPEVMDDAAESEAYDAMDFAASDGAFVDAALALAGLGAGGASGAAGTAGATAPVAKAGPRALDVGCGPGKLAVLLAERSARLQVVAGDLADTMLALAARRVTAAGLEGRVVTRRLDAKRLPFDDASFDLVVSNSVMHHVPDPVPFLRELGRVARPGGALLVRDLFRPADEAAAWAVVERVAPGDSTRQKQLFFDSLCAALTVEEAAAAAEAAGLGRGAGVRVHACSDRHLSIERAARGANPVLQSAP